MTRNSDLNQDKRIYAAIDLKSYYASAECISRGLDPLTTNLVVADASRTEKTICLAVSPSLKSYGIPGRARLFEVVQKVKEANAVRLQEAVKKRKAVFKEGRPVFSGTSHISTELDSDLSLGISYLVAPPRMLYYEKLSRKIYGIYLKYISPDDIVVYSIDEVLMDLTDYLALYNKSAYDLVRTMIRDILQETGITATAGIGPNLYLAKIAMDITAKHTEPDADGVRVAELTEESFRYTLWDHKPLTDFWQTGAGIMKRLAKLNITTMGELARASISQEDRLFKEFGVDAEIMIDHAWGLEPCTMKDIQAYKPSTNSISEGQVLSCPYTHDKARIIVAEMADTLVYRLVEKGLVAEGLTLDIAYDRENCDSGKYHGPVQTDRYGRMLPKPAHGISHFSNPSNLGSVIVNAALQIFDEKTDHSLTIRKITIAVVRVKPDTGIFQYDLFTDTVKIEKEKKLQDAMLDIKKKFGKNAVLKGMSLLDGATMRERNRQIGGHSAGSEDKKQKRI